MTAIPPGTVEDCGSEAITGVAAFKVKGNKIIESRSRN
jgi:hypothetical protein